MHRWTGNEWWHLCRRPSRVTDSVTGTTTWHAGARGKITLICIVYIAKAHRWLRRRRTCSADWRYRPLKRTLPSSESRRRRTHYRRGGVRLGRCWHSGPCDVAAGRDARAERGPHHARWGGMEPRRPAQRCRPRRQRRVGILLPLRQIAGTVPTVRISQLIFFFFRFAKELRGL